MRKLCYFLSALFMTAGIGSVCYFCGWLLLIKPILEVIKELELCTLSVNTLGWSMLKCIVSVPLAIALSSFGAIASSIFRVLGKQKGK